MIGRPHHRRHRSKKSSTNIIHITVRSAKTNNPAYSHRPHTLKVDDLTLNLSSPSQTNQSQKTNSTDTKKKAKCVKRRYFAIILITLFSLIAIVTISLSILLTKSKITVQRLNRTAVLRWNRTGITVAGVTGQYGNASHLLYNPRGMYIDWSNTMYIADFKNNRIQKYLMSSSFGETVAGQSSGLAGSGPTVLNTPFDVHSDLDGNVYVADTGNQRIQLWKQGSSTGVTIAGTTSIAGNLVNLLSAPYGIDYNFNTKGIYVSDTNNFRIIYFSPGKTNGTVITGGNGMGLSSTQLHNQYDVYLDTDSNSLLIPNCGANNVVRSVLGALNWTLVAGYLNGSSSTTATGFACPRGVNLDPMSNMYVVDRDNHRVQFFSAGENIGKTIVGTTALLGSNASQLNWPMVVMFDSQLNSYTTDSLNNRVQKFMRY